MQGAASLLAHIKEHAARGGTGPAVPKRVAMQVALAPIVVSLVSLRHGCAAQLLLRTKQALAAKDADANLTEFRMSTGRLVIVRLNPMPSRPIERPAQPAPGVAPRSQVGDTHGQLNDFCWILRSHGHPAPGNVYLINGDVADRGRFAFALSY